MNYKKLLLVFCFLFVASLFLLALTKNAYSQNLSSDLSVSDIVYADLAIRGYLDNISVEVFDNNQKNTVNLNNTRQWLPASTVKTFVAMYAFSEIAKNKLKLTDAVTIEDKNVVPNEMETDELPALQAGEDVTIERLIKQMIVQSDNTAYNVLLDVLNREKITKYIQDLGLTHSRVGSKLNLDTSQEQYEFNTSGYGFNTTTADDYAKAFILIKDNKIPKAKELFEILKQQKINNMIPAFLPKNVITAHKTGDLDPLYHDGGVIQAADRSYILTMFSNIGDPSILAHISYLVYTKDYNLVGKDPKSYAKVQSYAPVAQPIDSLVLNYKPPSNVLSESTTTNVRGPEITAADLGIKASDLSLSLKSVNLPKVVVPADSPFHFLVPTNQFLQKTLAIGSKAKARAEIDSIKLKLAEAQDLRKRGKDSQANLVIAGVQSKLAELVKNKEVKENPDLQTVVQSLSETRFILLGNILSSSPQKEKKLVIKTIAQQARNTVQDVLPNIPKSTNATNPSQKPLIGEVTNTSQTSITIKTPGGQQINVPTENLPIQIRSKDNKEAPSSISSVPVGTTIALVGSSKENTFVPSFALTNLPRQITAPQPVTVLKVNPKNNTMVVSENGVPVQVNITKDTTIKGPNTSITLKSIKPGDVVVVRGEPTVSLPAKSLTPTTTTPTSQTKTTSSPMPTKSTSATGVPGSSPALPTSTSQNQQKQSTPPTAQPNPQPKVIQSTVIQFIEKKQDVNKTPKKPDNVPQNIPRTQSQPPAKAAH